MSATTLSALQEFGKAAGIGGLALGVFFLLARQMLGLQVFANIGGDHTYRFLRLVIFAAFALALIGLLIYAVPLVVVGDNNTVVRGG